MEYSIVGKDVIVVSRVFSENLMPICLAAGAAAFICKCGKAHEHTGRIILCVS